MSKVLIAGGTGLIGTLLCKMLLERNEEVIILTTQRMVSKKIPRVQYVYWNPTQHYIDTDFSAQDIAIINLAGAGVAAKRWTSSRKKEIVDSRIDSLRTLYKAVESNQINATQIVSASAIGYYAVQDKLLTEDDYADKSFLSDTCSMWEAEAIKFRNLGLPASIARVGIVLSKEGGALKEFLKPLNAGIAGIPSSGKQIISWIHIEDICRLFLHLLDSISNETYNGVANTPVSTNELFDAILKIKKGIRIHIPTFVLQWVLGEMSIEILKSASVSNQKIRQNGFQCKFPSIEEAIRDLLI